MKKLKILTLITLAICSHTIEARKVNISRSDYRVKVTNFVCHCDNNYIVNLTCFIKPGREKAGFLTMTSFMPKPLDNFILELRHYYKPAYGRNPQYRPYYFNVDVEWCDLMRDSGDFKSMVISALLDFARFAFDAKEILRKCPLQGRWASENIDLDQLYEMGNLYGRTVPEGFHKFEVRLRSSKNYTYETFGLVLNVKSQRGLDMSMLNMG